MLYAGLDLNRKRLDLHLLGGEGATVEFGAAPPDVDDLRHLTARLDRHGEPIRAVRSAKKRVRPARATRRRNLHREETRGSYQQVTLLLEDPVLVAEPAQVLALLARQPLALARVDLRLLAPEPQRIGRDAQLTRDLRQRATARLEQLDRLAPKLLPGTASADDVAFPWTPTLPA